MSSTERVQIIEYNSIDNSPTVNNPSGRPERYSYEQIKEAVENSDGIKGNACTILNCTYTTLNRYLKKYPDLDDLYNHHNSMLIEEAESILMTKVREGNIPALLFFLKTRAGYRESGNIQITNNTANISWEEILKKSQKENSEETVIEGEFAEQSEISGW